MNYIMTTTKYYEFLLTERTLTNFNLVGQISRLLETRTGKYRNHINMTQYLKITEHTLNTQF